MDSRFISTMSQWAMYFLPSIVAGRRSGADECTASSGSSLFARPDLWLMWRQWICAVFPLPGPRQLVHAAHHCPRDRATPKLLLLHEQRSHPLPILRRRPRLAAPAFLA